MDVSNLRRWAGYDAPTLSSDRTPPTVLHLRNTPTCLKFTHYVRSDYDPLIGEPKIPTPASIQSRINTIRIVMIRIVRQSFVSMFLNECSINRQGAGQVPILGLLSAPFVETGHSLTPMQVTFNPVGAFR